MIENNIIVGIDLGTTNSVASILDSNKPKTIQIDNGKLLPSVVSYIDDKFIVGQTAKNMALLEPDKTVLSVKRKMGHDITFKLGNKEFRPEEISAFILKKIKETVTTKFEIESSISLRSVITVPAYFTEEQREATKHAAELAGMKVERIINEPTAAALAFGLNKIEDAIFAVYDLGGGTFDISIIENTDGIIEVKSTKGNNYLGGDDFDLLLSDFIWNKFIQKNQIKAKRSNKINARLIKISEDTKIKLSFDTNVSIRENFFLKYNDLPYHLEMEINRSEFEELIRKKITETIELLDQAVEDAKLDFSELEGIILVGGSSRIPLVSQLIEESTGIIPSLIDLPDEAVSHGATIQGAIIDHIDVETILVDITPKSLGIEAMDGNMYQHMIERISDTTSKLRMAVIIPRNTPVPAKRTKTFSAVVPFQEAYKLNVYQGESIIPDENKHIGETIFEVTEPVEYGKIDVTFELDLNGILKVSAIQTETGDNVEATFKSSRGMKIKQSEIKDDIITLDFASKSFVSRAEKLLHSGNVNDEDKSELSVLIEAYKQQKVSNDKNFTKTEGQLLDLMYYLEEND